MIKNSSSFKHIAPQWEVYKDLKNINEKNIHVQQIHLLITIVTSQSSFSTKLSKFYHYHVKKKSSFHFRIQEYRS